MRASSSGVNLRGLPIGFPLRVARRPARIAAMLEDVRSRMSSRSKEATEARTPRTRATYSIRTPPAVRAWGDLNPRPTG